METMKTKSNIERILSKTLIAFFAITFSSESMGQEEIPTDLREFEITIEQSDNGLKMQSSKGSSWINLGFSLDNDKPLAIDEYGMTELENVSTNKNLKLADYLFTIIKTKDGFTLTGIEGTAWKELSFSLPKNSKQSINQFGMTE